MQIREQVQFLIAWVTARAEKRGEDGFSAVEWMFIAIGVLAIAGVAVAAVMAYMRGQVGKLGNP